MTPPSASRAFTMIEMIIVIILVAILAGVIAPRMMNSGKRQADFESAEVTRLLGVAARRSALSGEVISIEYDQSGPRLSMTVLRENDAKRGPKQSWIEDPLVPAVDFSVIDIIRVTADGQPVPMNKGKWWIDFRPSEPRPSLWLLVGRRDSDPSEQWQIELLPEETSASRRGASEPSRASTSGALRIDLDASNQGERAW